LDVQTEFAEERDVYDIHKGDENDDDRK